MSFNRRRYQYDAVVTQTGPTPQDPFNPATLSWQQPEAQPNDTPGWVNRAAKYAVALVVASGLFTSNYTPPVQAQPASGGASSPTVLRFKVNKRFPCQYPSTFWSGFTPATTPPTPADQASAAQVYQQQPDFSKNNRYRSALESCDGEQPLGLVPTVTVVSTDWFQPQSQPYPYKKALPEALESCDGQQPGSILPPVVPTVTQFTPVYPNRQYPRQQVNPSRQQYLFWSGVTPSFAGGSAATSVSIRVARTYASRTQSVFWSTFTPSAAVPTDWIQPQSQPIAAKKVLLEAIEVSDGQSPLAAPSDYVPQYDSQPVITKKRVIAESVSAPVLVSEVVTVDKWFNQTSQPLFVKRAVSYESVVTVVSTSPETVTEDRWHPVWPQPFPSRLYLSTPQQQANSWSTFTPITVAANWVDVICPQPYPSRLVLKTAQVPYLFYDPSFAPETVSADRFVQPQSQPYPSRRTLVAAEQQAFFWSEFTPATVDQFLVAPAVSQPTVVRRQLITESVFVPVTVAPVDTDWLIQQNQPQVTNRLRPVANLVVPVNDDTVELDWLQPQSQPVIRKAGIQLNQVTVTNDDAVELDWFQPVSQPIVTKHPVVPDASTFVPSIETVTVDKWFNQTSQPYVTRRFLQQDSEFWHISTQPETVLADKWQPNCPQPYPYRKNLAAAQQQAFAWGLFTPAEIITIGGWNFNNLPQPDFTPRARRYQVSLIASGMMPWQISTAKEVVTEDRWHQPVSQPYPARPYRPAVNYPYLFWHISTAKEVVTADRWAQPQSQPTPKQVLATANYPYFFYNLVSQPEVDPDSFASSISQPIPAKLIHASQQQAFFWNARAEADVDPDSWASAVGQPAFLARRPVTEIVNVTESTPTGWFSQVDQPVVKRKVVTSESTAQPVTVAPVDTDWLSLQSQPVRAKRQVTSDAVVEPITVVETVTVDKWFNVQSQPIYLKRLITAAVPSVSWNVFTQETITADKFVQPISQPYPYRRGLSTSDQQSLAWNTSTAQETVTEDRWHPTWPQPFPAKRVVPAAYYPSFFWNTVVPEGANVEAVLTTGVTQPYPYQKNLHTSNQLYQFWSGFTPLFSNWLPVFPDRVEGKKYLNPSQVPYLSWNTSIEGEDVLADKWQPVYPEPYPFHQVLQTQQQLAQFWANFTPPPAPPSFINGTGFVSQTFEVTGTVTAGLQGTGNVKS